MNQHQLKSRLHKLQRSLATYSAGNRDLLFSARDSIRDASTDIATGAWKHLEPVLWGVEKLIDEVLRHGNLSEEKSIELGAKLVAFVTEGLAAPAPNVTLNAPRTSAATGATGAPGATLELPKLPEALPTVTHRENPLARRDAPSPPKLEIVEPANDAEVQATREHETDAEREHEAAARRAVASTVQISLDRVNESRLGVILVRTGRITQEDLERALAMQKLQPGRLGSVLVSMGIVEESDLVEALEDQRNATLELADGIVNGESGEASEPVADDPSGSYDDLSAAS